MEEEKKRIEKGIKKNEKGKEQQGRILEKGRIIKHNI